MFSEPTSLSEFERRITAIELPNVAIDRDALMYEVGRQAARAEMNRTVWPLATVASLAASVVLAVLLVREWNEPAQVIAVATTSATVEPEALAPEVKEPRESRILVEKSQAPGANASGASERNRGWFAWWPTPSRERTRETSTTSWIGYRSQLAETPTMANYANSGDPSPTARTAREMLEELLGS